MISKRFRSDFEAILMFTDVLFQMADWARQDSGLPPISNTHEDNTEDESENRITNDEESKSEIISSYAQYARSTLTDFSTKSPNLILVHVRVRY